MTTEQYAAPAPPTAGRDPIPCFNPATLQSLGEVPVTSPAEVARIVARAQEAQVDWARTSFAERRQVLEHVLAHLLDHADELCEMVVKDAGKTRENAMMGEIWPAAEKLRWTLAHGERFLRPERVPSGLFLHKRATILYEPRGVIGIICPWNYPLQNVLGPTIPALFAGNAVVAKVSEHVAWSSGRIQRIFEEALREHGHSPDLVQLVNGYGETGRALVESGVDLVVFTGSLPNGRRVIEASAKTVTPVVLELGGKDAFVVCEDADLEQAVHAALTGVFIASGQNCLAAERLLVCDGIYDRFEGEVVDRVRALRQGPPLGEETVDVGALTSPLQLDLVESLVDDAVKRGARLLCGGHRRKGGWFFEPTVLADVPRGARILSEETFGPVMVLCRVRDEEEAIERANETGYGLGATVMSQDGRRARRIAERIVSGNVSVNDFALTYMVMDLPFGGVRGSGFGRLNGRDGLRACTNPKALLEDRLPIAMPARLYPVGPFDYDTVRGTIRTLYGRGVRRRLSGLLELARAAGRRLTSR